MNPPNNLPFAPDDVSDEALESMATPEPTQVVTPRPVSSSPTPTPVRPLPDALNTPAPVAAQRPDIQSMPADAMTDKNMSSKPQEPEDMFADSTPVRAPVRTPVMPAMAPVPSSTGPSMVKVALLALLILVLLGGAAFGIYTLINKNSNDTTLKDPVVNTVPQATTTNVVTPIPTTPTSNETTSTDTEVDTTKGGLTLPPPVTIPPSGVNIPLPSTSTPVVVPSPSTTSVVDTDKDGLSDQQEIELGLDPNNPDSDGDGLTDGDENKLYGTNPLNRDTDKDTYPDGDEVKNGYNPRGDGKCATPTCEVPKLNP